MKLLFDQNLSPKLVNRLADLFPGSSHVVFVLGHDGEPIQSGMFPYLIVVGAIQPHRLDNNLSVVRGSPPKVIWLQLGNCTTAQVEAAEPGATPVLMNQGRLSTMSTQSREHGTRVRLFMAGRSLMVRSSPVLCISLLTVLVVCSGFTADDKLPSAQQAESWPKYENGKYVEKTFRFRPSSIEFRQTRFHVPTIAVLFGIKDNDILADYFLFSVAPRDAEILKEAIAADDGFITVVAFWVNLPTKRADWTGAPELWVEGRPLLGKLDKPQVKKRGGGPG